MRSVLVVTGRRIRGATASLRSGADLAGVHGTIDIRRAPSRSARVNAALPEGSPDGKQHIYARRGRLGPGAATA